MLTKLLLITGFVAVSRATLVDLIITNRCSDTIWPAVNTQAGTGPAESGFELQSGDTRNLTVDTNWNGRVWGRTNCTFDAEGNGNCLTGNCGGVLACTVTAVPVTLAEFNLPGGLSQSYYDISLVDGYNLPIAIEAILADDAPTRPMPNTTNPSCVGGLEGFSSVPFDPYAEGQTFLNTSSEFPLPFESELSARSVASWCPHDLKIQAAQHGDDFVPCASPCEQYKLGIYCCTGKYGSPSRCHPNYYAVRAKQACPDSYSYAYDDAYSTFTAPTGSGFKVVFCPGGRSTNILKTLNPSAATMVAPGLYTWAWALVLVVSFTL